MAAASGDCEALQGKRGFLWCRHRGLRQHRRGSSGTRRKRPRRLAVLLSLRAKPRRSGSSRRGNPRTPPRSRSLRPTARQRGRRLRSLSAGTTDWSVPWIAYAVPRRVWSEGANGRSCRTARAATAAVSYQSTWSGIVSGHSTSMITRIVAADTVVPTSPLGGPGYGLDPAKAAGAQNRVTKRDAPTSAPSTRTYGLSRPSGSAAVNTSARTERPGTRCTHC